LGKAFWTIDTISKAGNELKGVIKESLPEMSDAKLEKLGLKYEADEDIRMDKERLERLTENDIEDPTSIKAP
jgi:hypothetical protein